MEKSSGRKIHAHPDAVDERERLRVFREHRGKHAWDNAFRIDIGPAPYGFQLSTRFGIWGTFTGLPTSRALESASTIRGWNWRPDQRWISAPAVANVGAPRWGRSLTIISSASATATMRAPMGMASPSRPRGYPVPSNRSRWERTISAASSSDASLRTISYPRRQYPRMMSLSSAVKAPGFRRIARVLHLHRHCHTESLPHCLGSILIVRSFVKGELQ